jgi:hypothetical protein
VGTVAATGVPITTASITNPALVAAAAMVLGGLFGIASELWGTAMTSRAEPSTQPTGGSS